MYIVFFIPSNVWLNLKYIYAWQLKHVEQTNGNNYMQKLFWILQTHAWKMTPF